jgi:hypothetical protein
MNESIRTLSSLVHWNILSPGCDNNSSTANAKGYFLLVNSGNLKWRNKNLSQVVPSSFAKAIEVFVKFLISFPS